MSQTITLRSQSGWRAPPPLMWRFNARYRQDRIRPVYLEHGWVRYRERDGNGPAIASWM